jgi:IS5 family transposase
MFVKFGHRLGDKSLYREVSDSITWRRFCRIPLDGRVPQRSTWRKLTTRRGTTAVAGLNETLLAKAAEARLTVGVAFCAGAGSGGEPARGG